MCYMVGMAISPDKPLTPKLARLVEKLPTAPSQTQAGIDAGFGNGTNRASAAVQVTEALKKPNVQAALEAQNEATRSETIADVKERKERLSAFLRNADPTKADVRQAISASDQLNRMENLYIQRSEGRIQVEVAVTGAFFSQAIGWPEAQPALEAPEEEKSDASE